MSGDNFHISVTSDVREHFNMAMKMAFNHAAGNKAKAYRVSEKSGLILYWTESKQATNLPYEMDIDSAIEFVWGWLKNSNFGNEPDHDGSNKRGFSVFNEAWGHVEEEWQAFVAIKPTWIMYGK